MLWAPVTYDIDPVRSSVVALGRAPALHAAIAIVRHRRERSAGRRVDRVGLLGDGNQAGDGVRRRVAEDRLVAEALDAGIEEQLVRRRVRPGALVDVERHVEVAAARRGRRFRRHLRGRLVVAEADPVVAALVAALAVERERRALAARLVLGVEPDAILPELPGEAADDHAAALHEPRGDVVVAEPSPSASDRPHTGWRRCRPAAIEVSSLR